MISDSQVRESKLFRSAVKARRQLEAAQNIKDIPKANKAWQELSAILEGNGIAEETPTEDLPQSKMVDELESAFVE